MEDLFFKTKTRANGPMHTLYSSDGVALAYHPNPDVLRDCYLYEGDDKTPIKKGKPPRDRRADVQKPVSAHDGSSDGRTPEEGAEEGGEDTDSTASGDGEVPTDDSGTSLRRGHQGRQGLGQKVGSQAPTAILY